MPDYAHLMTRTRASRKEYEEAVIHLAEFPEEMEILWQYFTRGKKTDRTRSAWIFHQLSDVAPALFTPWHARFIEHGKAAKTDAEKRFISRLFSMHGLPNGEKLQSQLLEITFDWLLNAKESIAVKANSLTVLHRFCKIHPELENELRAIIADQYERSTAAFQSRAKHILRDLNPTGCW
jgi:hypothetical protein